MSESLVEPLSTESPISLYFDLATGRKADLEVVSRAALAYASAIREVAYIIDPSLEIHIELISGTESSLSLNSIIRSIKDRDILSKRNLFSLALVAIAWFRHETLVFGYQEFLKLFGEHPAASHLSQEDINAIAEKAAEIIQKRLAAAQVENVYRTIDADSAIQGVGATPNAGERPDAIVPRTEFHARSGTPTVERIEIIRRTTESTETLTLIRPFLEPGSRRWGFRGKGRIEFGAEILDSQAIAEIISGHTAIPMVGGIQLIVDLSTTEELRNGLWVVTDRTVKKIHQIIPPKIQMDITLPPSSPPPKKTPRSRRKH